MDFLTGALPNIMFIAGLIAIGLALGIEFKIVEVKGELSKRGRIGAFGVGIALIATSVVLYTRPGTLHTTTGAPTSVPATPVQVQAVLVGQAQASAAAPTTVESSQPTQSLIQPSSAPAATVAASDDRIATFRIQLMAAIADGRVSRDGADMLKKLEELHDALAKGDQKPAGDRLRDLQNRLQDGVKKQTVDSTFAQTGTAAIKQIAERYSLPIPPAKP